MVEIIRRSAAGAKADKLLNVIEPTRWNRAVLTSGGDPSGTIPTLKSILEEIQALWETNLTVLMITAPGTTPTSKALILNL